MFLFGYLIYAGNIYVFLFAYMVILMDGVHYMITNKKPRFVLFLISILIFSIFNHLNRFIMYYYPTYFKRGYGF